MIVMSLNDHPALRPAIFCQYADNNGVIHGKDFDVQELPALKSQNPTTKEAS